MSSQTDNSVSNTNPVRVSRDFSTFRVTLSRNETRKQKLSNSVSIMVPGDRSSITLNMTIREARALQNFLTQHLKD